MNLRLTQLRAAARERARAAQQLLGPAAGQPQVACYLMHVALECSLKAYILHKEGKQTIDLLRRVMRQEEYDELFFGSSGHQLQRLAGTAGLPRLLEAERRAPLLRGQTWANMCRAHRPYSLRYGCETIARNVAAAELRLGQEIVDTIDRSLWV